MNRKASKSSFFRVIFAKGYDGKPTLKVLTKEQHARMNGGKK